MNKTSRIIKSSKNIFKTFESSSSSLKKINVSSKFFTDKSSQSDFNEKNHLKSFDEVLKKYIPNDVYNEMARIYYGRVPSEIKVSENARQHAKDNKYELGAYEITTPKEQLRKERITRIGAIQTNFPASTSLPIKEQLKINFDRYEKIIEGAALNGVNVLCLQETWTAPFFFCTRENYPWVEFAESALSGSSTNFLKSLAKKHNMVIVSPILERDDHKQTLWNSAVIIDNHGEVLGKHHKIHIPRVGDFNESTYYMEGQLGCTVFETEFGKIGVNICYGRHHPLHWLSYNLNGAEMVFNPSATVNSLSETMWPIEARNAAIANSYFSIAINRVGTESFPNKFTSGDGKDSHSDFGQFYGSTYVTSPDGSRTPGLSRTEDGLLITEVDLNMCQQIKDAWKFSMTGRHKMYAKMLKEYSKPDYKPDLIKLKPSKLNNKNTLNEDFPKI